MHKTKTKNIRTSIQRKKKYAANDTEITPLEEHELIKQDRCKVIWGQLKKVKPVGEWCERDNSYETVIHNKKQQPRLPVPLS